MTEQGELTGMPKMGTLGKLASEYLRCRAEVEGAKETMEKIKPHLIKAFQEDGRDSITIGGRQISYAEVCKISVKNFNG